MEKLMLLRGDDLQDDQLLETDVMRFLAIIGIVFWIIFALIKSIPFRMPESDSRLSRPISEKKSTLVTPQPQVTLKADNEEQHMPTEIDEMHATPQLFSTKSLTESQAASRTKGSKLAPPKWRGVRLQFRSLKDMLALMTSKKIGLFCRAQARGFDLFFAGYPHGETVSFRGTARLPPKLWEIKSGKDYDYFLALLVKTHPAILSFPAKQVLVSFTDSELENRMDQILTRLQRQGQNGILSITSDGDVVFKAFVQEKEVGEKKNN